ncbi:outer membrane beta-barrel protein [Enterobacter mori]|uniref:outer membrane beta-barrel protein n=1 Tax=Enterobacter mori TaxID=539813 RepID=UPI001BDFEFA2|nr:outer membrane beta-barrel protein [Enterobacter mori]MBT1869013.1 outer membrane beta-barrel protein [Enterobacter mori]
MHKLNPAVVYILFGAFAMPVCASNSLSMSYALGKENGGGMMHGGNVMYKHDMNNFALVASGTFIQNTTGSGDTYLKNKYASIMPGIAFNITQDISLYGLVGLSCGSKMKPNQSHEIYGGAFGAGLFYDLTDNVQLNSGYELGIVNNKEVNAFIIGIGYLF